MLNFKEMQDRVGREMSLDLDSPLSNSQINRDTVKAFLNDGLLTLSQNITTKVREGYFLTYQDFSPPPQVPGKESELSLPEGILANKIRKVALKITDVYTILDRLTFDQYISLLGDIETSPSRPLGYFVIEEALAGDGQGRVKDSKIVFVPRSAFTTVSNIRIYFLRSVSFMEEDTDTPELANCEEYLIAHAKYRVGIEDPSRNRDDYSEWRNEKLKDTLEVYTDRFPVEGGEAMEFSCEALATSMNPVNMY